MERERLRNCSKEINSTYRQSKTTQLNLRQFIESRKTKDITFSDITGEFAESFKIFLKKELRRRNGHMNHCVCWPNRLIYIAVDRKVLWPNPIKDTAYEKKEAPKLKHINRSELKRTTEAPMMELARRTFIFSSPTGPGLCGYESSLFSILNVNANIREENRRDKCGFPAGRNSHV